jgi:hypothetical protein
MTASGSPGTTLHAKETSISLSVGEGMPSLSVEAETLIWNGAQKQVELEGGVLLRYGDTELRTGRLRLSMSAQDSLLSAHADGEVGIKRNGSVGGAESAKIEIGEDAVILRGEPWFSTAEGRFEGGVIEVGLTEERIRCLEGCRLVLNLESQ